MTEQTKPSQVDVDQVVLRFLSGRQIQEPQDLIDLKDFILGSLEFRPYNNVTKQEAVAVQWRRTASQILSDGYVYQGKACSDVAVVFLALCRAAGVTGQLVKLRSIDGTKTHSIVEVDLLGQWYRIDPSSRDAVPFLGQLNSESVWNKQYKVWKKGRDVWDLGLESAEDEQKIEEV